jgi:lysyl-tRNA synthetase class 2
MSSEIYELKKKQYLDAAARGRLAERYAKTHTPAEILALKERAAAEKIAVATAARVVAKREMGKAIFAHLADFSGKVQVYLNKGQAGEAGAAETFDAFKDDVAIGDFVGVQGELFLTRTGELTINVKSFALLNKALQTLPEKFHGIEDVETRYRQRYLDLVMNEEARYVARQRIAIVRTMRRCLEDHGFVEVETPVLQTTPSGALARPFYTHHNALDIECTLRIAPETWLKRLVGGGMDRVYEFARCFRNEGISAAHLQDFTMLEFYAAYWNWDDQSRFVTELVRRVINEVFGKTRVQVRGHEVEFAGEWPVFRIGELIKRDTGIDVEQVKTAEALRQHAQKAGLYEDEMQDLSWANLVDALYKKASRPKLIQPCYVTHYPAEMAPLARKNAKDPRYVDLFQLLVTGVELVKAYSELVDPVDQRARLEEQASARRAGDAEAMPMDHDFLLAMEHGFPPMAGVGIGIDRLVAILCGQDNIKEAVLFPLLRPTTAHGEG